MRPASAGIRFFTREERICDSTPIDWGDDVEFGGRSNDVNVTASSSESGNAMTFARSFPLKFRPVSAPSSSQRHAMSRDLSLDKMSAAPPSSSSCSSSSSATTTCATSLRLGASLLPPSDVDDTKNILHDKSGLKGKDNDLLDNLTRGYKGLVTREQLAQCPTPRLDLFVPPPLVSRQISALQATSGEHLHAIVTTHFERDCQWIGVK